MEQELNLDGRRVVVTGGASGIGRATVVALVNAGARVAALDRNGHALEAVASSLGGLAARLETYAVDITDEAAVESVISGLGSRWGGIDTVMHVAGIVHETSTDIRTVNVADWRTVIEVNLTGTFLVCRAAVRVMMEQGHGTIVVVGSQGGVTVPAGSFPYGASKGGVNGLAMTMDKHLSAHGIRVVNVCPHSIDTPLFREVADQAGIDVERAVSTAHAAGGMGKAMALLASESSSYFRGPLLTI